MKRRTATVTAVAGFLIGVMVPPAVATSYNTGWHKIFGHSTSCALALGSINDSTRKSGAQTINRKGCNAGNAAVAVPANRLFVITHLFRPSHNWQCSPDVWKKNTSSSSGITATSALVISAYCPAGGTYSGTSAHTRIADNGGEHYKSLSTVAVTF